MKHINLTKGAVALVDDCDFAMLTQMGNWSLSNKGYALHWTTQHGKRKALYMHRVIMSAPPHLQVDHINRDKLDNRRENLRFATRSQNQANKATPINNSSGFKGVNEHYGRWEARLRYRGKRLHLGRFDDAHHAAQVYDTAALILYQEFAGCNFPNQAPTDSLRQYVLQRLARYDLP